MKIHKILTVFLVCVVLLCQTAPAQDKKHPEDPRVARLVGLAKVWGTVKYFHPFLAYRDIDWDKALVETIPKVNAAKSAQEYEAALNQMLAVLNDAPTRAEIKAEIKDVTATTPATDAKHVRTENKVLVIDAAEIAKAAAKDFNAVSQFVKSINEALPNATGIVIDARSATRMIDLDAFFFDMFIRQTLPAMLDANLVLGTSRYRLHSGYATQTGGGYSDYYSAVANSSPKMIQGRAKTKTPPIAFIVNQNSPASSELLTGLQSANRAFVIQEGDGKPEAGGAVFTTDLPDNIKVRIRTSEAIYPDGSVEFQADKIVTANGMKEAMQAVQENKIGPRPTRTAPPVAQIGKRDNPYPEMTFPTVEYRLLALFRFWNVINYFFPYKNLIGDSWQTVLPRYITKFEANKDQADYQLTVREMVTEIRDAHGGVRNTNAAGEKLGMFLPLAFLGYIEEKSVVKKVLDETLPIKVGDVVLTIDGEPVEKKREYLARYIGASTPQGLERWVHYRLLAGPKDSVVKLRVRGLDNQVREISLPRSAAISDPRFADGFARTMPVVHILPGGFGYVDLARLQAGEVDKMFDTIKNTSAVIFDMRGYPNGTAWSIAPRLTEKTNVVAALFSRPFITGPSLSDPELAESGSHSFAQKLPGRKGDVYKGKVVMLINEEAISQSEHTCLFFESATDVTFIGTPTAGANGDITFMVLPGNLQVTFSGHDVRHADGRQLQRVGIQPTIRVAPTIRGLIEKRDEVLERAVKYLGESSKK
ncbi:MAG TPA: S41 family peptidase [Pyrinomonadaceae bacterium]|nr:S41 family peptidase [Pyrinomonadaceae bacterium]